MVIACIPIALIYVIGVASGAQGDLWVWFATAGITLFGASVFALYGLVFGLAFKSESAVGAASGSLVVFAFLGNIFIPLSGVMLTIAKFTPLYGIVSLARYPLTEGYSVDMQGNLTHEALWVPLVNVAVWTLILGAPDGLPRAARSGPTVRDTPRPRYPDVDLDGGVPDLWGAARLAARRRVVGLPRVPGQRGHRHDRRPARSPGRRAAAPHGLRGGLHLRLHAVTDRPARRVEPHSAGERLRRLRDAGGHHGAAVADHRRGGPGGDRLPREPRGLRVPLRSAVVAVIAVTVAGALTLVITGSLAELWPLLLLPALIGSFGLLLRRMILGDERREVLQRTPGRRGRARPGGARCA
uniref:ABC transporter permease n=1 Tax=Janibacter limosus TaxID=53458 RepID=A0AC61U727_9MICO|nr:ABC transporter permease [Janibacter limosus]